MPQKKAKLVRGNHKILSTKDRTSKKLKAKSRLLRSNRKVISKNQELSKTPKDNGNHDSLKADETSCTKKNIPHVEPNSQAKTPFDNLDRLPNDKEKIPVHKSKKSSDNPKVSENDLQSQNILTSQTHNHEPCVLSSMETVKIINVNTNTALTGNKAKKRRKPFAHVNKTEDRSLSPIVLLERLSIEKIKQIIFVNKEKLESLNSSNNIDNDDLSENVNPSKRRKTSLNQSYTRRKLHPNSECESPPVCCEQESLTPSVSSVQETKGKQKTSILENRENRSVEKITSKSDVNIDNKAEEIKPIRNEESQNISKIDKSNFKNNQSKNEKSANKFENKSNSKKNAENHQNLSGNHISRKSSQRQTNQDASCTNKSEDRTNQHDSVTSERRTSEPKTKRGQNTFVTQEKHDESKIIKNKNKLIGKRIENVSVSTRSKNKLENNSVNEHSITEKEKDENVSVGVKKQSRTENKLEHEKGQNSPVTEKSSSEHKKEEIQNKCTDEKIKSTSVTRKSQNKLKNEEHQTETVNKKNETEKCKKGNHNNKQSASRSSQDKLEKSLNETIINETISQNVSENIEGHTLRTGNRQNKTDFNDSQDEENLSRISNANNSIHESVAITLDTIKSEIESDDADSSEENEVLNIKIFEMDDAININEEDLVSYQLKRSMRVESKQFKDNEVVNVKILQIEEHQNEAENNDELIEDKLKNTEEKNLIDSRIKRFDKAVKDSIEAAKTTASDELMDGKSKVIEENDQEKNVSLNENEKVELENVASKKKLVIKVKIVKIDNPVVDVKDCTSQFCDNNTSNDHIQEEKISSDLIDNDKESNTIGKTSNFSPEKSVSKTIEDNFEFEKTTNYPEFSDDKLNQISEKTLIDSCDKVDNQENEKMEVENEALINNDIVKIKIFENDKALDIEDYFSEPCIENILEDKIEAEKTTIITELNNSTLKDTKEKSITDSDTMDFNTAINDNNEKPTDSRQKSFIKNIQKKIKALGAMNSKDLNKCESNDAEEKTKKKSTSLKKDLIDFCEKKFNNIVENVIEAEKRESSNELSETQKKAIKEKVLIDTETKNISKVVKNVVQVKKTKSNIELKEGKSQTTKENSSVNCSSKGISNTIKDKIEADGTSNSDVSSADKSTDNKGISATNLCVQNVSKVIETKIEIMKTKNSNDVSESKSNDTTKKSSKTSVKRVDKILDDKLEVERDKSSNALRVEKHEAIEQKKLINSCAKNISNTAKDESAKRNELRTEKSTGNKEKIVQNEIGVDKSECSTEVSELKSNAAIKTSLIKPCAGTVGKIVEEILEASKDKSSNSLSDEKSKAVQEEKLTNLRSKTINSVKDKTAKSNELNKDTSIDNNKKESIVKSSNALSDEKFKAVQEGKLTNLCSKTINSVKDKTAKSNELNNDKLINNNKKVAIDSCVKSVSKTIQNKIETENNDSSKNISEAQSNVTNEKSSPESCVKRVSLCGSVKMVKNKIEAEQSKTSNARSDEKSKSTKEKSSVDSCDKRINKTVKDKTEGEKTEKDNVLNKDKSENINEKKLSDSCVKNFTKTKINQIEAQKAAVDNVLNKEKSENTNEKKLSDSCVKNVTKIKTDQIESQKAAVDNNLHKQSMNDIREKVIVEYISNDVSSMVKNKIEEEKTKSNNELPVNKSIATNAKSLNDSCDKIVSNAVEDKKEEKKTTKDNVISKKKSIGTSERMSDSCVNNYNKTKNDKVELEKNINDKGAHNKNLRHSKEKVAVESLSNNVSNAVKKKSEDGKTKITNEQVNDESKTTSAKYLIDSSKENVSKTVDITEEETVRNNSLSEGNSVINKKSLSDSSVKNVKEKVLVEPCTKIVSESIKDKIEMEEINNRNNAGNGQLKKTDEVILSDTGTKNARKIIKDEMVLEKTTRKLNVDKSNDAEGKSINSCSKNISESMNISIDEEITTPSKTKEKPKEAEKKSTDSCVKSIEVNETDKTEATKTISSEAKTSSEESEQIESAKDKVLSDSNAKVVDPEKNICSEEMEVESQEQLTDQQENNLVIPCAPSTVSSKAKPKTVKKKKPNKYRRLKKHMIRKRKKKNRVKICSNELINTKSSKMMQLLGTICLNKMQERSKSTAEIEQPVDVVFSDPVNRSVLKKTFRDPVTGKFCSKAVAKRKASRGLVAKKSATRSAMVEIPADLMRNKSVPTNSKAVCVSNALTQNKSFSNSNNKLLSSSTNSSNLSKTSDTSRNTSSSQLSSGSGKDNISNLNRYTQPLENVQDEITIEEHEIKIEEEDPEILEIVVEEETPSDVNYVTASEIFRGINSKPNKSTSRAEILKNLRSILPLNKGSSSRTSCTNVNSVRSSAFERNEVIDASGNSNGNLHRHVEQSGRSRTSLPSQNLYNHNVRDVSDGLYNNVHRNNRHSINSNDNSFNDSVASTSANSSSTMSISVREAFEKISSDLLGSYESQFEMDREGYSNGINDLLHISDSDGEQLSESNLDSDHNTANDSVINHQNSQPLAGGSTSQPSTHSSIFYQKPVKKKVIDETMHMRLQCPRCWLECLGMKRLQRHFNTCGPLPLFTCTICHTKLKQKRSLAGHYLSYHANLVDEDTLPDVIAETVRRSHEEREEIMNSGFLTLPSHISVFCDRCQTMYQRVPTSHRICCLRCKQPLSYYCEKCTRRQAVSLRLQIHAQSKCTERPRCPHCEYEAVSPAMLGEHVLLQHQAATVMQQQQQQQQPASLFCRHGCGLGFRLRLSRNRHEAHCAKEKDQQCRFCPFKTKHRSVIKVHMQNHMINNDFTPRKTVTLTPKEADEVSSLIEAYCRPCHDMFETPVSSGTRCPRCHGCALYRCLGCGNTDTVYREMRRHVSQTHYPMTVGLRGRPPLKNRACRRCDARFADSASLRRHERATGRCRPRCRRCGTSFQSAGTLKRHLDVSCGVEARLRCEHCSFITKNRFSIVRHLQTQHPDVYNGSTVSCPTCHERFSNIYLYENHAKNCGGKGTQ